MQISAVEFRKNCFKILKQVENTHSEIIITKRGKPIAKIVHFDKDNSRDPLLGMLPNAGKTIGDLTQPVTDTQDWEMD